MKYLFFIVMFFVIGFFSFGQETEITDVKKRNFRGVSPIMNEQTNECRGYYTYYLDEKVGKGEFRFVIRIYDLDLKLIKETPIVMAKRTTLEGSTFNGEDFLFVFRNIKDRASVYITVDSKGNRINEIQIPDSKRRLGSAQVYPAEDGFFIVKPVKEKKYGYTVLKYDRDLDQKWERKFMPTKGYAAVEAVETGGDRIILIQVVGKGMFSKNMIGEVLCLDNNSGDILYNHPLFDGEVTCIPSSFLIDKDKNVVTGGMYFKGEKWDAKNSDGIFFLKLSPDGKQLAYTKDAWDAGIQKLIKENTTVRFAIGSRPKVLFEDIVQAPDGSYQIISETFRKSLQMINIKLKDGITGRYIGNINDHRLKAGTSGQQPDGKPMNFEILDFIVFNYGADGVLSDLNIIEKPHTNITCYKPYHRYRGLRLAIMVKEMGWFNYGFTHIEKGSDKKVLVSSNFVIGEPYVGLTTIEKGVVSETTKISLGRKESRGGSLGVAPAKPGKFFMWLYDKKERTISMKIMDMK